MFTGDRARSDDVVGPASNHFVIPYAKSAAGSPDPFVIPYPRFVAGIPDLAAVDALKQAGIEAAPVSRPARSLSTEEFFIVNLVGIALSLVVGIFVLKNVWIGLFGTYIVPIPVLFGYAYFRRLRGDKVDVAGLRFNPGISWAGKTHSIYPRE